MINQLNVGSLSALPLQGELQLVGPGGTCISIRTTRPEESPLIFPATSCAKAVYVNAPSGCVASVIIHDPPATVAVGDCAVPSLLIVIILPDSPAPLNVGVLFFVMLSVFEIPVSLEAERSRAEGTDALMSIVTFKIPEKLLQALEWHAFALYAIDAPALWVSKVTVQFPAPSTVAIGV